MLILFLVSTGLLRAIQSKSESLPAKHYPEFLFMGTVCSRAHAATESYPLPFQPTSPSFLDEIHIQQNEVSMGFFYSFRYNFIFIIENIKTKNVQKSNPLTQDTLAFISNPSFPSRPALHLSFSSFLPFSLKLLITNPGWWEFHLCCLPTNP